MPGYKWNSITKLLFDQVHKSHGRCTLLSIPSRNPRNPYCTSDGAQKNHTDENVQKSGIVQKKDTDKVFNNAGTRRWRTPWLFHPSAKERAISQVCIFLKVILHFKIRDSHPGCSPAKPKSPRLFLIFRNNI